MIITIVLFALSAATMPTNTSLTTASLCQADSIAADFLFLIDGSSSMCAYNLQFATNFSLLIDQISDKNIDARFSVVAFGGTPSIILPFSADVATAKIALSSVNCSRSGWEAGLEAIRMTLQNSGADMDKSMCMTSNSATCILEWRNNATRQIIMATDEDSDIPTN
ncbi:hypothetical protein HK100_002594, partial [Physocladia obscura]